MKEREKVQPSGKTRNAFLSKPLGVAGEVGISGLFVGRHPDTHKYVVAGLVEVGIEAVAGHYLHHHGRIKKWYWRYVWTLPQSFSLYEHAQAAHRNAALNYSCISVAPSC